MKQLLIVNNNTYAAKLPSGALDNAKDLSSLAPGAIVLFTLASNAKLTAEPISNFGIALGRPNGQVPFIIPEVDVKTLKTICSYPVAASAFSASITLPAPEDVATLVNPTSMVHSPIAEYGITFVKKGAVPHERNTWNVQVQSQSTSASDIAALLVKAINDKSNESFPFHAIDISSNDDPGTFTVTCDNSGEDWDILFTDCLDSLNQEKEYHSQDGITLDYDMGNCSVILGRKAIGDKADIQDLASRCAAGKGFTDTNRNGDTIYPGYPEDVADTTYNVYTLRFRVGRDSAKTRDERVWQVVHIAVPTSFNGLKESLDDILLS